jgi:hypothetical protein
MLLTAEVAAIQVVAYYGDHLCDMDVYRGTHNRNDELLPAAQCQQYPRNSSNNCEGVKAVIENSLPLTIDQKLEELGISPASPPQPFGTYAEAVQTGNLLCFARKEELQICRSAASGARYRQRRAQQGLPR